MLPRFLEVIGLQVLQELQLVTHHVWRGSVKVRFPGIPTREPSARVNPWWGFRTYPYEGTDRVWSWFLDAHEKGDAVTLARPAGFKPATPGLGTGAG